MSVRRYRITVKGRDYDVEVGELSSSPVTVRVDGVAYQVDLPGKDQPAPQAAPAPASAPTKAAAPPPAAPAPAPPRPSAPPANGGDGVVRAMMPGRIVRVNVSQGDPVTVGQALIVMESMKMENTIAATRDGTVKSVLVREGDSVQHGQTLIEVG